MTLPFMVTFLTRIYQCLSAAHPFNIKTVNKLKGMDMIGYNWLSRFLTLTVTSVLLVSYNNCAPIHSAKNSQLPSFIEPTELNEQQELYFSGKTLYASKCAQCHGPFEASTKKQRSANDIFNAFQTISQMNGLTDLSDNDVYAISYALNYVEDDEGELACTSAPDVGVVAMHRLNYFEYRNTIKSVTGVHLQEDPNFPAEEVSEFANTAAKLKISRQHLDWYMDTAVQVSEQIFNNSNLRGQVVNCDLRLEVCRAVSLQSFAEKAFRRPPQTDEINRLVEFFNNLKDQNLSDEEAMKLTFASILSSPQFLFRNTKLTRPNDPLAQEKLDGHEFAARLSYFLWGDAPDAVLLNQSISGELEDTDKLKIEIRRMLDDPRAITHLSKNFFSYWFGIHKFQASTPNSSLFPDFNESIRQDMTTESQLFFQSLVKGNQTLAAVLTKPRTFINKNLADYYGISGNFDDTFREVDLSTTPRGGILTHGSVLTQTSHSSGTSIVRRGAFVALNLQCIEIATPPDGITALAPANGEDSIRQRLEQHRSNPQCASCHKVMDPPGFGLENFNAVGQFRTLDDEGFPLDTRGELFGGSEFDNIKELASLLSHDRRYQKCAVQKLSTFALGRSLQKFDACTIEKIVNNAGNGTLEDLIFEIVSSDPFRYERGE